MKRSKYTQNIFKFLGKMQNGTFIAKAIAEESRTHTVLCDKYSHLRQIKYLQYLYITAHFLFASAKYLFTQNCKAPSGVEIFDGFSQSELKQDADLARRGLAKDAKIARRRAYAFDSLRL